MTSTEPTFHHEGSVARDNARQHNGNIYDEVQYLGGVHYHLHGHHGKNKNEHEHLDSSPAEMGRSHTWGKEDSSSESPFAILNLAASLSQILEMCNNTIGTAHPLDRSRRASDRHAQLLQSIAEDTFCVSLNVERLQPGVAHSADSVKCVETARRVQKLPILWLKRSLIPTPITRSKLP